jgi:hypothetical protein
MMLKQLQKQSWISTANGNSPGRASKLVNQRTPFLDLHNQQFELCVPVHVDNAELYVAMSIMREQQSKTSRTGKRAIQLAGSAVEGSLDLDLVFLFLSSFPAMAAWSLSR